MAIASNKPEHLQGVAHIQEPVKIRSSGLTSDALRRLRRNRAALIGAVIVILNILVALFASGLAPRSFDDTSFKSSNAAPIWITKIFPSMKPREEGGYVKTDKSYWLGADKLGRDLLSRIVYGARISIAIAVVGPWISILVGLLVGLVAGYKAGRVDNILMRFVDIMYAFPTILLIILLMTVFRAGSGQHEPGTLV